MANLSKTTRDHEEIQRWAEERGAHPACVRGTGAADDIGMLRLDFPGYSGEESLQEISWDDFFEKFDERGLALLYQEETAGGERSNFNKLVSAETAEEVDEPSHGRKQSTSRSRKKAASKSAAKSSAAPASATSRKTAPVSKKAVKKAAGTKKAAATSKKSAATKKKTAPMKKTALKKAVKKAPAKKAATKKAVKKATAPKKAVKKVAAKKAAVKKGAGRKR